MKTAGELIYRGTVAESVAGTLVATQIVLGLLVKQAIRVKRFVYEHTLAVAGDKGVGLSDTTIATTINTVDDSNTIVCSVSTPQTRVIRQISLSGTSETDESYIRDNNLTRELWVIVKGPGTTVLSINYEIVCEVFDLTDSELLAMVI
jgi:hypothetical protein